MTEDDWNSGIQLDFNEVSFTVTAGGGKQIQILRGVSGKCQPGRLLAIMGASGAGKTTLLDILAYNHYGGTVTGTVTVNGKPRRRKEFTKLSCYVQQRDVLLSSATVREAVLTSALLKLPSGMLRAEKEERVDSVLKELDLEGCVNTLVGDESIGIKGISGGQKRRVSVGVELVKDPRLIFLDEPTSGLDSEMAATLMATLVQLARRNRTVVCTIHQPNSDITSRFDDFLLLAKGQAVFGGPWDESVEWFRSQGFSCPLYTNPTDYYLSVVKDESAVAALVPAFAQRAAELRAASEARASAPSNSGVSEKDLEAQRQALELEDRAPGKQGARPQTSVANQVMVLSHRFLRTWYRNPQMLASEVVQYMFMALLVGLMYLQVSSDAVTGTFDRSSCIWFSLAVLSFTPSYTAAVVWDKERLLMRRELAGQQYNPSAYFLGKTAVTLPFELVQGVMYVLISYFMVGFQLDAGKLFMQIAIYVVFLWTSETIGLLVGIISRTATTSVVLLTLVMLLLLSFSGFLTVEVKPYFRWVKDASYLTYAYTAAVQSEFSGLTLYDDGTPVDGMSLIPPQLDNGMGLWANFGILVGQLFAYRVLALLAMLTFAHFHWL